MIPSSEATTQMRKVLPNLIQESSKFVARSSKGIYLWMNKAKSDAENISSLQISFPAELRDDPSVSAAYGCFIALLPIDSDLIDATLIKTLNSHSKSEEVILVNGGRLFCAVSGPDISVRFDMN